MSPNDEVRSAFMRAISNFELIAELQPRIPGNRDDLFDASERANSRLLNALRDYSQEATAFKKGALAVVPVKT